MDGFPKPPFWGDNGHLVVVSWHLKMGTFTKRMVDQSFKLAQIEACELALHCICFSVFHLSKMGLPHPKQQDKGMLPMLPRFSFASSILQSFNASSYFNPSILQHTSITQPICQLGFKAVFNRVSAFPVLFPPEHNRETSPVPALNQLCSQLLGSFSVRTMPHTVLNAFALVGIFVKDSTTIQAFARLPFLSCFLLLFPADCFITFLIGSPGQSMNQAVRCGLTGWSRFLRQLIFPVSH